MEGEDRSVLGQLLGLAGAAVAVLSLWQPWYGFRVPQELIQQAVQQAGQFGVLGPAILRGAQYLQSAGPLHVSAWQVMTGSPALVLCASALGGFLSLLGLQGQARGAARLVGWCGLLVVLVALYQLVRPPGPAGFLHAATGLWLGLAGGAGLLVGGWLGQAAARRAERGAWEVHPATELSGFSQYPAQP